MTFKNSILYGIVSIIFSLESYGQWRAGYAEAIITPPLGTHMVEPQAQKAEGVHDELFLKVIAVSDGIEQIVMASYDLLGMDLQFAANIRQVASKATGLPVTNLMLSCTHAHNVPMTVSLGGEDEKRNQKWEAELMEITSTTIQKALEQLQRVKISAGKAEVQVAYNRRLMMFNRARMLPNPYGPVVREVDILNFGFANMADALLFSYPAHPVAVHSGSLEFTADFPAFAVNAIKNKLNQEVNPIYFQGCAGDVNVDPLRGGYEGAEKVGQKLGKATLRALNAAVDVRLEGIKVSNRKLHLPYRSIEPEVADKLLQRVTEGLKAVRERETDSIQIMDTEHVLNWAKVVQEVAKNPEIHPGLPFEIQSFAFGKGLVVIAFPHELFVEYQLYIKEHSPFKNTLVFAYTNGSESYIPTADATYLNGYEIHGAQHRYARPYLAPEVDDMIRSNVADVLEKLFDQY